LQAHLKATLADAQTKAFKRACKENTSNGITKNWLNPENLKTLALIKRTSFCM